MSGLNRKKKGNRVYSSQCGCLGTFQMNSIAVDDDTIKESLLLLPSPYKKNLINLFGGERKIPSWVSERACLETADVISMTCLHAAIARRYPPLVQPVHKSATTGLSIDKKRDKKETDKLKWIIGWTKKKTFDELTVCCEDKMGKTRGRVLVCIRLNASPAYSVAAAAVPDGQWSRKLRPFFSSIYYPSLYDVFVNYRTRRRRERKKLCSWRRIGQ